MDQKDPLLNKLKAPLQNQAKPPFAYGDQAIFRALANNKPAIMGAAANTNNIPTQSILDALRLPKNQSEAEKYQNAITQQKNTGTLSSSQLPPSAAVLPLEKTQNIFSHPTEQDINNAFNTLNSLKTPMGYTQATMVSNLPNKISQLQNATRDFSLLSTDINKWAAKKAQDYIDNHDNYLNLSLPDILKNGAPKDKRMYLGELQNQIISKMSVRGKDNFIEDERNKLQELQDRVTYGISLVNQHKGN